MKQLKRGSDRLRPGADICVWGGVLNTLRDSGHDVVWAGDWPEDRQFLPPTLLRLCILSSTFSFDLAPLPSLPASQLPLL